MKFFTKNNLNKKIFTGVFVILYFLVGTFFVFPDSVFASKKSITIKSDADGGYTNLISDMGTKPWGESRGGTTLEQYLNTMFVWAVWIAIMLAVIMIAVGGLQYTSNESIPMKTKAKETIQNAIFGLVLALASYLILYVINPDLVKIKLDFGAKKSSFNEGVYRDYVEAKSVKSLI